MEDKAFTEELVRRLNALIEDESVRAVVRSLIDARVNCGAEVVSHPSVQVVVLNDGLSDYFQVGFLGMLNGLAGLPDKRQLGRVVAHYDDTGSLTHFSANFNE